MRPNDDAVQRDRHAGGSSDITAARPERPAAKAGIDVWIKRRRRRWVFLFAGLLVLALWAGAAYYTSCPVPINPVVWHEAAARREVAAALPLGSTRQQVLAWLRANGIRHDDTANPQCGIVNIGASKPYIGWLFDRGEVYMDFDFDCAGKLIGEKVRIWVMSL